MPEPGGTVNKTDFKHRLIKLAEAYAEDLHRRSVGNARVSYSVSAFFLWCLFEGRIVVEDRIPTPQEIIEAFKARGKEDA